MSDPSRQRRRWGPGTGPWLLATVAAAAGAAYVFWPRPQSLPARGGAAVPGRDTMTYTQRQGAARTRPATGPSGLAEMLSKRSTSDWLLLDPADRTFGGEPGGLPPFGSMGSPGAAKAQRQGGFRRQAAGSVEEVSFWRIAGASVEQVRAHYESAAQRLGFAALPAESQPPAPPRQPRAAVNRVFLRVQPDRPRREEVLILQIAPDGPQAVRAMLWLRYPMGT